MAALEAHDLIHRDSVGGAISVAYPFSERPTAHRVRIASGVEAFAMCAIDALGIAFMLATPIRVMSADADSGQPVDVSVDPVGRSEWSPREAVVVTGCVGTGDSVECSCPHTNFAASRVRGETLLEAIDGCSGAVLSIPEAIESARRAFGTLLAGGDA